MSIEKFCRLCAEKFPLSCLKDIRDLQNDQLDSLILQYLQIKIIDNNEFPNTACKLCCKTVLDVHEFLTRVKTAQQKLRDIFSQTELSNLDIKLENEHDSDQNTSKSKLNNTLTNGRSTLFLPNYNRTEINEVKTERDYGNDYDTIDHFLNDYIGETNDSDSSVQKISDEKSEKLTHDDTHVKNKENLSKIKSPINTKKKNLRKIHWQCYKCEERLRTAQCLQDHFQEVHKCKVEYVCVECNALFKNLNEFKSHYYGHDVVKKSKTYRFNYTCETCGKQFYDSTNYKVHRDMHLGIKRFECEICGKNFAKKQYKEIHKLTVCSKSSTSKKDTVNEYMNPEENESKTPENDCDENLEVNTKLTNNIEPVIESKWKCDNCEENFESAHNLQKHIKKIHGIINNEYICTVCDELFVNNDKYDEHLKTVHDLVSGIQTGPIYKCTKCSKQFNHKSTYLAHTLIHTGVKRFSCKECGRKFHLKQHLIAHSLTHLESTNDYEVKCNQCDKICKNQYLLDRHLKSHRPADEKYKHKCDICKRKFMYITSLIAHQNQGHENEEFICDQCGKVFKNKYRLAEHLNTHNDGFTYSCDECSKGFKSVSALKAHKKTHAEKTHECEVCGKKFSLRGQLTVHSTIHSGKLPHECSYCKKQFRRKYYLRVHLRQHTGERPYSCTECNHYFANDGNFIKHLKGRHGLQNVSIVNKRRYPFDD